MGDGAFLMGVFVTKRRHRLRRQDAGWEDGVAEVMDKRQKRQM